MTQTFKYGDKHPEKDLFFIGRSKTKDKYYNSFVCKEVFDKHVIKKREYHTNLFKNNPFQVILRSAKSRSSSNLTEKYLLELFEKQQGKCYWFNVPMSLDRIKGFKNPHLVTIDRLDNSKGYTKDNIVLACLTANLGRGNTPVEIWEQFVNQLKLNATRETN